MWRSSYNPTAFKVSTWYIEQSQKFFQKAKWELHVILLWDGWALGIHIEWD